MNVHNKDPEYIENDVIGINFKEIEESGTNYPLNHLKSIYDLYDFIYDLIKDTDCIAIDSCQEAETEPHYAQLDHMLLITIGTYLWDHASAENLNLSGFINFLRKADERKNGSWEDVDHMVKEIASYDSSSAFVEQYIVFKLFSKQNRDRAVESCCKRLQYFMQKRKDS